MWKGEVPKEHLSDVLLYLIRLSDMCGIDLGDAALRKIVKNAGMYPAPSKGTCVRFSNNPVQCYKILKYFINLF
jgi:hypothetical protein